MNKDTFNLLKIFKKSDKQIDVSDENKIIHTRVCLLIILSRSDYYDRLHDIIHNYYKRAKSKYENFSYYYIMYDSEIKEEYMITNDILYIRGNETFIPGILNKTLFAIKLFQDKYDYIVRSNVSSIIHVDILITTLHESNINHGCGRCLNLQWLDPPNGIIDNTYQNTNFAQGTCIILSKKAVDTLLNPNCEIPYDIIDDVAIGYALKEYEITTVPNIFYRHKPNNYNNPKEITYILQTVKNRCDLLIANM